MVDREDSLPFPGLAGLRPGDHLCVVTETGEESRAFRSAFMAQGIARNEKVIRVAAGGGPPVVDPRDACLADGRFDPDRWIAFLREEADRAAKAGYSALRVVRETDRPLQGVPGAERLADCEARVDRIFPECRVLAVCHYDARRVPAADLLDVIEAHPRVIVGGEVFENPGYVPPEEKCAPDGAARTLRRRLRSLAEQARREKGRRTSEERARAFVESVPLGIHMYELGGDGRLVFAGGNPAADAILGVDHRGFVGKTIEEAFPPLADTEVPDRYRTVARTGITWRTDRIRYEHGTIRGTYEVTAFRTGPGRMVATFRDVTEQKRNEEALRESRERYRALFDESPVSLWEEDFSGAKAFVEDLRAAGVSDFRRHFREHPGDLVRCLGMVRLRDVNRMTLALYRAKDKEALLEGLDRLVTPGYLGMVRDVIVSLAEGERLFESEVATQILAGVEIWVVARVTVLPGHEKTWDRVLVSLVDITAWKAADTAVRASLREKEVLLREVHHRVKNNLQVISSLLSLQARAVKEPAVAAVLGESRNRIETIALIHESLYRASDLAHVDFSATVGRLCATVLQTYNIDPKRIRIVKDIRVPPMAVDRALPCALIVNELLVNALKHAFPEGGSGTISVRFSREEGNYRIVVSDDGRGLPDGFDMESEANIGLRIITILARQLKGRVKIEGAGGTAVSVTFPGKGNAP